MTYEPVTITITRVNTETWEDYARRCADIVHYVAQRSAHLRSQSTMLRINGDDLAEVRTDEWTGISEADCERVMEVSDPTRKQSTRRLAEEE